MCLMLKVGLKDRSLQPAELQSLSLQVLRVFIGDVM